MYKLTFRQAKSITAVLAAPVILGACGGTEGDLLDALNVDEETPLCVSSQTLGVDFFEANDGNRYFTKAGEVSFSQARGNVDALPALKDAGYADEEATTLPNGFARFVNAYAATKKINPYIGDFEQLCIGTMRATEIIEYTEPAEGARQVIEARFAYDIEFNDLIDDLDLEDALLEGPVGQNWKGEGFGTFVKTNKGWRMEFARWVE